MPDLPIERAAVTDAGEIVAGALAARIPEVDDDALRALFRYPVPEDGPDGSCPAVKVPDPEPYRLDRTLGVVDDPEARARSVWSGRLWRLNRIVRDLAAATGSDWLGVYRQVERKGAPAVLVKLAYVGEYSRAEFPLTGAFAATSNNAAVGLSGRPVLVEDVARHEGAYYACDVKVLSEYCCPILGGSGDVLGIIDAESFQPGHFGPTVVAAIDRVAAELGRSGLLA